MRSVKEIAAQLGIPHHYRARILQKLTRKGLFLSMQGTTGGFTLRRPADQITFLQVIDAVDGPAIRRTCGVGFGE